MTRPQVGPINAKLFALVLTAVGNKRDIQQNIQPVRTGSNYPKRFSFGTNGEIKLREQPANVHLENSGTCLCAFVASFR